MTEIDHSRLNAFLQKDAAANPAATWLIHGEEMLVEQAAGRVCAHLTGGESSELTSESVDGLAENIPDLLEQLNTFGFMSPVKVVVFKDARIFDTRGAEQRQVGQITEALESDQIPRAAKMFLSLCGRSGISVSEAVDSHKSHPALNSLAAEVGLAGVQRLAEHCREQGWSTPRATVDPSDALLNAIEKGYPENHFLVITVNSRVAKNLRLYKTINKHGVIIDCHVPAGDRRADKMAQESVLRQAMDERLAKVGKRAVPGLFQALCQTTGFNLRTFSQNIEKLIDYTGQRRDITVEDIDAVLSSTRIEPVYELTNAVADRKTIQALVTLNTILGAGWHPLQVLSALANQIRKLLVAKDFCTGPHGRGWSANMSYQQFQQQVLPKIQAFDQEVSRMIDSWQDDAGDEGSPTAKKQKKKSGIDLSLAPNPKNAYPIYQTLLKSEKFTRGELIQAMVLLSQADQQLKSSGPQAELVIKKTIADICRGNQSQPG